MNKRIIPNYDQLLIGALLSAAAGGLDAYTYLEHGEVFAGLQTGNFIMIGAHFGTHNLPPIGKYAWSVFMFAIGTMIVRYIQHAYKEKYKLDRSTFILSYEIILLTIAGIIAPFVQDFVVTGILSMAAVAQLQEFRKLNGSPFTSLMMTGNLRTLAESFFDTFILKDTKIRPTFIKTFVIIFSFALGAAISGFSTLILGNSTIIISILFLALTIYFGYTLNSK